MPFAALLAFALAAPQDPGQEPAPPAPAIELRNPGPVPFDAVLAVTVPFPRGAHEEVPALRVAGVDWPCHTLLRWGDGSVMASQLQLRVVLAAGEERRVEIEQVAERAEVQAFQVAEVFAGDLPLRTELVDPWGRSFFARLTPDETAGPEGWVRSDGLVHVRRLRGLHQRDGEALLGLEAWLVVYAGERRAELTVTLRNDGEGPLGPLGAVRFQEFALWIDEPSLQLRPRRPGLDLIPRPTVDEDSGRIRQTLMVPSDQLYLGDRTGRTWRFDLFADGEDVAPELRERARRAVEHPAVAVAELDWVRHTGAFGAHGGPAPRMGPTTLAADRAVGIWRAKTEIGPFGGFGDPRDPAVQGSPRHGNSALHNLLRWRDRELFGVAEAMVLAQSLRPSPAASPRRPEATAPWRQGISQRLQLRPHGFGALDYEHFSVDLLYDWYWLTGDPFARAELARIGAGLPRLLEGLPFRTSRGEGWCLQGGVLIARATGDRGLVDYLRKRWTEEVLPDLGPEGSSYALAQPPHPQAFGEAVEFDAPWQMAALVYGLHALLQEDPEDGAVRDALLRVARCMAIPGWLEGVGPKYLVARESSERFTLPRGTGPLDGTAWMELGAFTLAEELAERAEDRSLFRSRADALMEPQGKLVPGGVVANPWFQIHLDRVLRQ